AAGADADPGLEKRFPFSPRGRGVLEPLEVQTGGNEVLLGLLGGPVSPGDMRPDRADQLRLIRGAGGVIFGVIAAKLITPGPRFGRHRSRAQIILHHADAASGFLSPRNSAT